MITFQLKYRAQYRDEYDKVIPTPLNPGVQLIGDSGRVGLYEVKPSNLVFKKLATFEIPIPATATILGDVTPLSDGDRQRLRLFYFDGFDWQPSAGEYFRDSTGKEYIRAVSNHLTCFTLALDNRPPPQLIGPLLSAIVLDKNPFTPNNDGINDNVILQFGLGQAASVSVKVLDANGDLVRTLLDRGSMQAGFNTLQWDGRYAFSTRTVPQGIYVVVVKAETPSAKDTQSIGVGVMK
ncbi:MAG: gliding motility-associated C-terminal domain-containing protein [Candidatus Riflebacteria bacterium]|nr:gliding motility-associated C-terminal domain-containing protein [Candidatus Riflebacteria bacterium]